MSIPKLFPLHLKVHQQGQGAPIFDRCTTIRRGETSDGLAFSGVYRGWSICPLARRGRLTSLAVTWLDRVFIENGADGPQEVSK